MLKKDLNTKQVGNLFGVDESTVRRWAMAGKIKCISSAGGHRKFSYNDIVSFANQKGIILSKNDKSKNLTPKESVKEISDLPVQINEQTEHEITVGDYTTSYFYMCGSAQKVMNANKDIPGAEELTKLQDEFYELEKNVMNTNNIIIKFFISQTYKHLRLIQNRG